HYNLAYIMESQLNDPDTAIEHYKLAIKYSPKKYAFAYKNIGKIYYEKGELDKAIEAYKMAIEKLPKDTLAYNDLAVVLTEKGLIEEAVEELKKALKLEPTNETVKRNLEKAYILLREKHKREKKNE
ncbi:MAG: tetratricopeptide repeat protein, partial [Candidatus Schekmanbacteria bacterium]